MKHTYLDNAATTPMYQDVIDEMTEKMQGVYGNPSSTHASGRMARHVVDEARSNIAQYIGADDNEIIFTSGGSESNNSAIMSAVNTFPERKEIITSSIEHPSVAKALEKLAENDGYTIHYVSPNQPKAEFLTEIKRLTSDQTALISVMAVNNETGQVLPVKEIAAIGKKAGVLVHSDFVQGLGTRPIDVKNLGVDFLSVSAHKIGGPKFLGFLYVKHGTPWKQLINGGEQEDKKRAGTQNVPAIAGFSKAIDHLDNLADKNAKFLSLQNELIKILNAENIDYSINQVASDYGYEQSPHILNLWIKGMPSEIALTNLDLAGFSISAGSACTAGSITPSHVLTDLHKTNDQAAISESIRISFGPFSEIEEVKSFADTLVKIVKRYHNH